MRADFLPFSPPSIGDEEIDEVVDTLRSDWITTGPKVKRFEEAFANAVGASHALALNSCTGALHTALAGLGVSDGDAVITTPMTFCSTVNVIENLGAIPILTDVDPETLNLDPAGVQDLLSRNKIPLPNGIAVETRNVKALLPVHLYGHPCDLDGLIGVAETRRLPVVEDAAHALIARYHGRAIGADPLPEREIPVLTAFSFYATKNLTTTEGGMLTGPQSVLQEARVLSLHGMNQDAYRRYSSEGSWFYEVMRPGFKYNMTDLQASIGLHQLRRLPGFQQRRREIAERYTDAFSGSEVLDCPTCRAEVDHAWHLYVVRVKLEALRIGRAEFIEELKRRNIGTSVHFIPVHMHRYYREKYGYQPADFPVTYSEYQRIMSLPIYPRMTDSDVEDVISAVLDVAAEYAV